MSTRLDTRTDMVAELKKIPVIKWTPLLQAIIAEAEAGEFHDYKNIKYVCGKVAANELLSICAKQDFNDDEEVKKILLAEADKIRNGTYDEEADEADKAAMRAFAPAALHEVLGL